MAEKRSSADTPSLLKKKTRHGDFFAPGKIGPQTVRDLFKWPSRLLDVLRDQRSQMWSQFLHNMGCAATTAGPLVLARGVECCPAARVDGIAFGSFYSGMLTPEIGLSFISQSLRARGHDPKVQHVWASDCARWPQLLHEAHAPCHAM